MFPLLIRAHAIVAFGWAAGNVWAPVPPAALTQPPIPPCSPDTALHLHIFLALVMGTCREVTQAAAPAHWGSGRVAAVRAQACEAPRALFISHPATGCGWVNSFNSALTPWMPCWWGPRWASQLRGGSAHPSSIHGPSNEGISELTDADGVSERNLLAFGQRSKAWKGWDMQVLKGWWQPWLSLVT